MVKAVSALRTGGQPTRFHSGRGGASLLVRLTAHPHNATQATLHDSGVLHIHLQTARTGARLDQALLTYLAQHLGLPREHLAIAAGEEQPGKILVVYDISPVELERRLRAWLANERYTA